MKRRGSLSTLFSILILFLALIVTLAGMVFFAGYLFKSSDSGVVSAFGYSFHVASADDAQPELVKQNTFILAENIEPQALQSGNLVTVVTVDGRKFVATYYAAQDHLPQKPYLFTRVGSTETIVLTELQLQTVALHRYHSDLIGRIFYTFSVNRQAFLLAEGLLLLIFVIALMIVISRREQIRMPKRKRRKAEPRYNLGRLITVERDVEFEKSSAKKE